MEYKIVHNLNNLYNILNILKNLKNKIMYSLIYKNAYKDLLIII